VAQFQFLDILLSLFGIGNDKELLYNTFEKWVNASLPAELPAGVEAFCFNLYDDGEGKWSVELVGAASFDKENGDWACDEVFSTREHPLRWESGKSWQEVQAQVKALLSEYLRKGKHAALLRSRQGLALGFVDGDLELL